MRAANRLVAEASSSADKIVLKVEFQTQAMSLLESLMNDDIGLEATGDGLYFLGERLGSGHGESKTLLIRPVAFEPLPASVLFAPCWPFQC